MNSHRLTRFRWEFIRWGGTACCAGRVQPTALSLRFSIQYDAQRRLGLQRGPRRAAADAGRWAGGFLCLLLQFVCSALASTGNAPEPARSSHNRVGHLCSSAHPRAPALHRLVLTPLAYASPLVHIALRLWLHGSARPSYTARKMECRIG
jgi:hypothetical protein